MALDRDKKPVRTLSSNVGQLLWTGILPADREPLVAAQMLAPDMFCGWGIRTLSGSAPPFNPLSYHNGSVWPHDNSIIAKGLADRGYTTESLAVMNAMYQEALQFARKHLSAASTVDA